MRGTTSRFNAFVASIDPNIEGRPTPQHAATSVPTVAAAGGWPTAIPSASAESPASSAGTAGGRSVLEQRYPAIVRSLTLLWGYPEMNQYFDKIAAGNDASLKLEPAALSELMVLADVHRRICPHSPARRVDDVYGPGRWATPWQTASR